MSIGRNHAAVHRVSISAPHAYVTRISNQSAQPRASTENCAKEFNRRKIHWLKKRTSGLDDLTQAPMQGIVSRNYTELLAAGLIVLARSKRWKAAIHSARATSSVAVRYVAGAGPEAAIARATALFAQQIDPATYQTLPITGATALVASTGGDQCRCAVWRLLEREAVRDEGVHSMRSRSGSYGMLFIASTTVFPSSISVFSTAFA